MFGNLFGRSTTKEFEKDARENYPMPEPEPAPKDPEVYRVGVTESGKTTLTLVTDSGYNYMTLTMTQDGCERLIRMLRSTYLETDDSINEVEE